MAAIACNPSTPEAKAGEARVLGQPGLPARPSLKKTKNKKLVLLALKHTLKRTTAQYILPVIRKTTPLGNRQEAFYPPTGYT
jgi:hypothetical protein